jgi:hypothetical protein
MPLDDFPDCHIPSVQLGSSGRACGPILCPTILALLDRFLSERSRPLQRLNRAARSPIARRYRKRQNSPAGPRSERPAHAARAADRPARRRGADQSRDRPAPLPLTPDDRDTPLPRLPQAAASKRPPIRPGAVVGRRSDHGVALVHRARRDGKTTSRAQTGLISRAAKTQRQAIECGFAPAMLTT